MSYKVPDRTHMPTRLLDPEEARFVKRCWREGWSRREAVNDCAREFMTPGVSDRVEKDRFRRVVEKFYSDPRRWDPDIDEQAVFRAFMGDRQVWQDLTYYERSEVFRRLIAIYLGHGHHPRYPDRSGLDGIHAWAEKVGEPTDRVGQIVCKRKERARVA